MLIIAEVGAIERFPDARHLCAWAGLTPTVRSSDGKARLGHISRQGSPALRWALVEAAQKCTTGGGPLREQLRADRQTPRPQDRQGRRRPPDPHPQLLRPARRRDPLPGAPQPGEREREAGGRTMTAAHATPRLRLVPPTAARCERSGELAVCHGLANPRTADHLIEPLSTARHSGPHRATGWMTGAPTSPAGSPSANRHTTTRGP